MLIEPLGDVANDADYFFLFKTGCFPAADHCFRGVSGSGIRLTWNDTKSAEKLLTLGAIVDLEFALVMLHAETESRKISAMSL